MNVGRCRPRQRCHATLGVITSREAELVITTARAPSFALPPPPWTTATTATSPTRRPRQPSQLPLLHGLAAFMIFIILFAMSWDTLEPTEYGLVQNGFTGYVDLRPEAVYTGGRYFVWLRHFFLVFPRNRRNLDFDFGGRRPPIPARTGPDPDDKESGGQPVTFSVSFQYQLQQHTVPIVYQTYGLAWEDSYMRFAQQAITNVAQSFTPKQFWNDRRGIELAMLDRVNRTIYDQGYAVVRNLQLLAVTFKPNYEETITNIQLQEQLKVTKSYTLEVTRAQGGRHPAVADGGRRRGHWRVGDARGVDYCQPGGGGGAAARAVDQGRVVLVAQAAVGVVECRVPAVCED